MQQAITTICQVENSSYASVKMKPIANMLKATLGLCRQIAKGY